MVGSALNWTSIEPWIRRSGRPVPIRARRPGGDGRKAAPPRVRPHERAKANARPATIAGEHPRHAGGAEYDHEHHRVESGQIADLDQISHGHCVWAMLAIVNPVNT